MFRKSYKLSLHPANNIRKINLCSKMKILTLFLFCVLFYANITFAQWQHIATIGNYELRAVKFFNEHTGIVAGEGGIWRSTNSGVNWVNVLSGHNFNAFSFPDNNIGYSVGDSGKIFKTTNIGINWYQIGIGVTTKKLKTVSFPTVNIGWIMGQNGKILYTFNGGSTFTSQTNGDTTHDINYLQMINSTTGYFCGSNISETFGYSPNGGLNWLYTLNMNGNILYSVCHISGSIALSVGSNGRIRRTTSNGTTWTIIPSPVTVNLNNIAFLDANTGYIAGNSGNILKTTNSGLNWFIDATISGNNLKCISFINTNTAWIVGNNGIVIRMGIPVGINTLVSIHSYTLEQNFPNPFNPLTIITVQIPTKSLIKLVIYDLSGHEIVTIADKEVDAGRFEYTFNGEIYSSGIYIYSLFVNNQGMESKKMVLIK